MLHVHHEFYPADTIGAKAAFERSRKRESRHCLQHLASMQ
jgi:hypothetical protein